MVSAHWAAADHWAASSSWGWLRFMHCTHPRNHHRQPTHRPIEDACPRSLYQTCFQLALHRSFLLLFLFIKLQLLHQLRRASLWVVSSPPLCLRISTHCRLASPPQSRSSTDRPPPSHPVRLSRCRYVSDLTCFLLPIHIALHLPSSSPSPVCRCDSRALRPTDKQSQPLIWLPPITLPSARPMLANLPPLTFLSLATGSPRLAVTALLLL